MTAPRILVVDDEPNIRDLLITSLRFAGYQVRAVANGAQTISAVLEEEPDLIILDVMLPDMNGFSVTKRLRGAGYTAPILFLTAKDDTEDKIAGLNAGGDDYVTKPFSLDEIVARIQAAGAGFRSLAEDIDTTTSAGRLVFHVFASIAQFERERIAERTREGLAAARRRGRVGGRPPALSPEQKKEVQRLRDDDRRSIAELARLFRVSQNTIRRA